MFDLAYTEAGLNLVNMQYHQLVAERHNNLIIRFVYLKHTNDTDPFNISGVDGGNESE